MWRSHRHATDTEEGYGGCVHQAQQSVTLLTAKLQDPRAMSGLSEGNWPSGQTTWEFLRAAANMGERAAGVVWGGGRRRQGSHMGDLETSSQRSRKKLLQVQDSRAAQVSCSAVSGEGRGPRKQPREQRWGLKAKLCRLHQQKECPPHPSDEHNSEPQMGEVMEGGGKYMAARSEGSLQLRREGSLTEEAR